MSGAAGVAPRESASLPPADLPVRLYMRALRQYQKLIDLKRFTPEKVSASVVACYKYVASLKHFSSQYVPGFNGIPL